MIDLSFLTNEEQECILTVLKRDAELKRLEEQRLLNLQKRVNDRSKFRYLSGEWFYETKQRRHQDRIHGSDIIMASMRHVVYPLTLLESSHTSSSEYGLENDSMEFLSGVQGPQTRLQSMFQVKSPDESDPHPPKRRLHVANEQRKNPFNSKHVEQNTAEEADRTMELSPPKVHRTTFDIYISKAALKQDQSTRCANGEILPLQPDYNIQECTEAKETSSPTMICDNEESLQTNQLKKSKSRCWDSLLFPSQLATNTRPEGTSYSLQLTEEEQQDVDVKILHQTNEKMTKDMEDLQPTANVFIGKIIPTKHLTDKLPPVNERHLASIEQEVITAGDEDARSTTHLETENLNRHLLLNTEQVKGDVSYRNPFEIFPSHEERTSETYCSSVEIKYRENSPETPGSVNNKHRITVPDSTLESPSVRSKKHFLQPEGATEMNTNTDDGTYRADIVFISEETDDILTVAQAIGAKPIITLVRQESSKQRRSSSTDIKGAEISRMKLFWENKCTPSTVLREASNPFDIDSRYKSKEKCSTPGAKSQKSEPSNEPKDVTSQTSAPTTTTTTTAAAKKQVPSWEGLDYKEVVNSPGRRRNSNEKHDDVRKSPSKTCHPRALPREHKLQSSPLKMFPIDLKPVGKDQKETPSPSRTCMCSPLRVPEHRPTDMAPIDLNMFPDDAVIVHPHGLNQCDSPQKKKDLTLARSFIPNDNQFYLGPHQRAHLPPFPPDTLEQGHYLVDDLDAKTHESLKYQGMSFGQLRGSVSVPLLEQDEIESISSIDTLSRRRNTSSSVSDISLSTDAGSWSTMSGSVSSIFPEDGDRNIQGSIQCAVNYIQKLGEFHIFVVLCRDLAVGDIKKRRSDPYVKCYLLPDKMKLGKRKTTVKKKSFYPVFNEILKFQIQMEDLKTLTLNLSVWHNDTFGRNGFLGEVNLKMSDWDFCNAQINEYTLKAQVSAEISRSPSFHASQNKGKMRVGLRFLQQIPHDKSPCKTETNEVHIWIKDCKDLPSVRGVIIDPFVKCIVLPDTSWKGRQKTRVVKRTANPLFNHTMVYDGFHYEDLREACVEISVWDHDRLNNRFIGGVRLGIGTGKSYGVDVDWMDSTVEETNLWHRMLHSNGEWVEDVLPLRKLSSSM